MIPVIPKTHIIKHFRHKNKNEHWEPETYEHLEGKKFFYKNIPKCYDPEIEKIISDGNKKQIADVVFTLGPSFTFAVEFQCANITVEKIAYKNEFYEKCGYFPIWVFGGKYYKNRVKKRFHTNYYNTYEIQRIKKVEEFQFRFGSGGYLLHFNPNIPIFYSSKFKFRYNAETLGWYKTIFSSTNTQKIIDYFISACKTAQLNAHYVDGSIW
jgi:hypothetical protein